MILNSVFLNTLLSNTLRPCSSRNRTDQVCSPHKTTDKIIVLYILMFTISWMQFWFGRLIKISEGFYTSKGDYKNLLPLCGSVWYYDCFKAHATELEALSFCVCVWTQYCPLCSYQISLFLVIPQRHVTKKCGCALLTSDVFQILIILIWRYFQIIVCGFEFNSLQVNAHANVVEPPKDDARVEREPPTESDSLKLTKKLRLLFDDQLLECLFIYGPCTIFHASINFTKIVKS